MQSQMPSQFPQQLIEELEQVSSREGRSKSATWTRSQYDDSENIEEDIIILYDSTSDISNKVRLDLFQ